MGAVWWCLCFCVLGILAVPCRGIKPEEVTIDVILLDDEASPWSLKFVKGEIEKAIETIKTINTSVGPLNFTPNFEGFNTNFYRNRGCRSSACEGVDKIQILLDSHKLGCSVLGPTCTYATFHIVDVEQGLKHSTPILSAGSFGLSCDNTVNLQRLLPPARKI
ncbi:heat-stable enterotoxin receptor-like, partial [Morone saxatilis]|uniref:heat-stable enterotoxin receptor-like n=1 Tax=Morone saxatilis TaxID=34816 RepID=UPI0015E20BE1